jgi:hypothetical protein
MSRFTRALTPARRDAGLRRLRTLNRLLIGAAVVGTGLLTDVAAHAFPGHKRAVTAKAATASPAVTRRAARHGRSHPRRHARHNVPGTLHPPAQPPTTTHSATHSAAPTAVVTTSAPQPAPAPAPAPTPAPVVSGGS